MSWVQIKRALNRSLGTKEFKPLDELIKGQKTLIASDNLYSYIGDPNTIYSVSHNQGYVNTKKIPHTLKMNTSGSGRIYMEARSSSGDYLGQLLVYKNNVLIHTIAVPWGSSAPVTYNPLPLNVSFTKNDVFSFELKSNTIGVVEIAKLQLKADIIDGSLIEITESEE